MKNHKKEINFNKTLGFGFIQKQDKRKKLLLLWQQVSKNYLPVDSFKKDFPKATLSYDLEKDSNKFYKNRILFYRKYGGFERNEREVISTLPAACWQQYFQLCWYHSPQTHCKISESDSHDAQYRPVVGLYIFLRHGRRVNAFLLRHNCHFSFHAVIFSFIYNALTIILLWRKWQHDRKNRKTNFVYPQRILQLFLLKLKDKVRLPDSNHLNYQVDFIQT